MHIGFWHVWAVFANTTLATTHYGCQQACNLLSSITSNSTFHLSHSAGDCASYGFVRLLCLQVCSSSMR